MRLRDWGVAILVAGLMLAVPAAAFGGPYPSSSYAWSTGCDTGTRQAPVTVVFQDFSTPAYAKAAIDSQTVIHDSRGGWDPLPAQSWFLNMRDKPGAGGIDTCESEGQGRVSQPSADGQSRTELRLWSNTASRNVAGTATRQLKTTTLCGASPGNPKWIPRADAHNLGRNSIETAFQGSTPFQGPYPMTEAFWGNTNSFQRCDGATINGSTGHVAIVRPRDGFGFKTSLLGPKLRHPDTGSATVPGCAATIDDHAGHIRQAVVDKLQAADVNTVSFGVGWKTVAPCSGASEPNWDWERWDTIFDDLDAAGIRPLATVSGAPPGSNPQWVDPNCNTGNPLPADDTSPDGALDQWRLFVKGVATVMTIDPQTNQPRVYGPGGAIGKPAIEVLNEPNSKQYWGDCDPDAPGATERYIRLLRYAERGVIQSGADVSILLGSTAPHTATVSGDHVAWKTWLQRIFNHPSWNYQVGAVGSTVTVNEAVSAIGLHPYRTPDDKQAEISPADSAVLQLQDAHTLAEANGADHPIWVIETGTTVTGPSGVASNVGTYSGQTAPGAGPGGTYPPLSGDLAIKAVEDQNIYNALRNEGVPVTTMFEVHDENTNLGDKLAGYGAFFDPYQNAGFPPDLTQWQFVAKDTYCQLAFERGESPC